MSLHFPTSSLRCLSVAVVLASTQQFNDTLAAFDSYPVRAAQAPPLVPPSTHAHAPAQTLTRWAALHIVVELGGGKDAHGGQALYPFNIARNAASMWPPSTALHTPTPPTPAMPAVESAASNASEEASPPRLALPSPAWLLLLDVDTLPLANAPAFSLALRHAQATAQTGPNPTTRGLTAFIPMTLQTKRRASEARLLKDLRRCVSAANAGLRLGSLPPCWLSSLPPGLASALDAHSPTAAHVHLNKTALATALQRELEPFHAQDYPAAYVGTVDTAAWWAADTCAPPTPARYTLDFEPYAAVPWPLPLPFDEAYRGHGFSKSDWWFQLCAGANCSLHVLPAPALLARRSLDTATHSAVRNRQQNWGLFAQRQRLARAAQGIHCQPAGPCTRVEPTAPPMPTPTAEPTPTPSPTQPNADAAPGTRRSAGMLRRLAALRERYELRQAGSG